MSRVLAMLRRLSAARFAVHRAVLAADRSGFATFRWARLWVTLRRNGADDAGARRWVVAERAYQLKLWTSPPVPAWAAALLPPESRSAPPRPPSSFEGDVQDLCRLVMALDASRFERTPLSVRARDWAAGRPGLGERWADGALARLGDLGVLTKAPGARRLPTWHLPSRVEALRRLDASHPGAGTAPE